MSDSLLRRLARWGRRGPSDVKLSPEEKRAERLRRKNEGVAILREESDPPEGLARAEEPHVLWLHKGEHVPGDFTSRAVQALQGHPRAGLVFDAVRSHAPLMRRDALCQAGGWAGNRRATWAAMAALGWRAIDLDGLPYPLPPLVGAELLAAPATLFLSLSGRDWAWPLTARFLEEQTFPHDQTHLFVLDTSQDDAFSTPVREWLQRCDYAGTTWMPATVGTPGVADRPRPETLDAVRHAVGAIYNRFARNCATPLALFLEDDVIPPPDAYARLAADFGPQTVTVSGVVRGRHEKYRRGYPIAWRWDAEGKREHVAEESGVTAVGGNGFGCLAMRGEVLQRHVFRSGPPLQDFDFNFYHQVIRVEHGEARLDWACVCHHHDGPTAWI